MVQASGVWTGGLYLRQPVGGEGIASVIVNHLKLLVGGVQLRDGVVTVSDILGRIFTRAGFHVLAMERGYASTIYGAHQYDPIVVAEEPPVSWGDPEIDILVALDYDSNPDAQEQPNRDTILRHSKYLKDGGLLVYDSSTGDIHTEALERRGIKIFPIPARNIARDELKRDVVKNVVTVGALFRLLEFDRDATHLRALLEERFLRKGREIVDLNLRAAQRGLEVVESVLKAKSWTNVGYRLEPRPTKEPMLLLSGNDALSMGAIRAGCRYYAGYPITPASAILEFMEEHLPKFGGRAMQGQNERESIRAAIGAAITGVRSMVGTSGPGLSLKVEEFGVSGVSEVPMVIVDTQRAGPSTGMPTKSEQGDLFLVAYGGHGEIPRIVLAPATQEECYTLMIDAHNLADKYQCPVFFLTDLNLSEGRKVVPQSFFEQQAVTIDRSTLVREGDLRRDGTYKRFVFTPSGISPRLVPGTVGGVIKVTGSEHALLAASAFWFTAIKWTGGLYLIYLGLKLLRAGDRSGDAPVPAPPDSRRRLFATPDAGRAAAAARAGYGDGGRALYPPVAVPHSGGETAVGESFRGHLRGAEFLRAVCRPGSDLLPDSSPPHRKVQWVANICFGRGWRDGTDPPQRHAACTCGRGGAGPGQGERGRLTIAEL